MGVGSVAGTSRGDRAIERIERDLAGTICAARAGTGLWDRADSASARRVYGLLGVHFVLGAEAFVFGFSFFGFRISLPPRFFSFDIA